MKQLFLVVVLLALGGAGLGLLDLSRNTSAESMVSLPPTSSNADDPKANVRTVSGYAEAQQQPLASAKPGASVVSKPKNVAPQPESLPPPRSVSEPTPLMVDPMGVPIVPLK